jgi:hypothetical protein
VPDERSAGHRPLQSVAGKPEPEGAAVTDLEPLIDVTAVRVLAYYLVELTFPDCTQRVIDLELMLWGPMFEPLLADYRLFRQVTVDHDAAQSI